jgi:signal transduction histidine kinase
MQPTVPCDVHAIMENCLQLLNNCLKDRVDVKRNFTPSAFMLMAHESMLHQALLNILTNAEQAIHDKGTITITTCLLGKNLIITIGDTGQGISPENINRITDPFFTTKDAGKGTGLGLSITREIIQHFNGTLEFESTLQKGTLVKITLPVTIL